MSRAKEQPDKLVERRIASDSISESSASMGTDLRHKRLIIPRHIKEPRMPMHSRTYEVSAQQLERRHQHPARGVVGQRVEVAAVADEACIIVR